MDWLIQTIRQGQCGIEVIRVAVALLCVLCKEDDVNAQHLEIRARDRAQELVHTLETADQSFREVQWDVHNSASRQGLSVHWTIDAFESRRGKTNALADATLAIRIHNATPKNAWQITQLNDQTNVSKGDRSATVSASSTTFGDAAFGVLVTFRSPAGSLAEAGEYRAQLTGTISAP